MFVKESTTTIGVISLTDTLENPLKGRPYPSVMVGIPAYNEEANIGWIVESAKKSVDLVVVANDASKDATVETAEKAGATVITHKFNQGYGGACLTLFQAAQKYQPDFLIMLDADGQHNPEDIPKFISKMREGYDVVIGSRFLNNNDGHKIPLYREFGIKTIDKATNIASKGKVCITDTLCGYRAFSKRAYMRIHHLDPSMHGSFDMLVQLADAGMKFGEVPVAVRYDLEDTSKDGPFHMAAELLWGVLQVIVTKRPLPFFGIPGILLLIVGFVLSIMALETVAVTGVWATTLTLLAVMMLMMGLLLISVALILFAVSEMIRTVKYT